MEEVPDVLEDKVAGLLHLEGEGVAVEPGSDEEEDLVEEKEEREVVSNNHPALQRKPNLLLTKIQELQE